MIIQLIILSIIALCLFLFIHFSARKKLRKEGHQMSGEPYRAALENLANYFPGYLSSFYRYFDHGELVFIGQYSRCEFRASFTPSTHLMLVPPTKLFMSCKFSSNSRLKIFIYKENPTAVFLAKRLEVDDPELSPFFIYANRPDEAKRFFADPNKRVLLKEFIKDGWAPPQILGNKIVISRTIKDHILDPNFVRDTLNKMITLAAPHDVQFRNTQDNQQINPNLIKQSTKFPDAPRYALFILGAAVTIKLAIVLLTSSFASSDLFAVQGKIAKIYLGGDGRASYIDLESSGGIGRYHSYFGRVWPGMRKLKEGDLIMITAWEQGQFGEYRSSRPSIYIWQLSKGQDLIVSSDDIAKLKNEGNISKNRYANWSLFAGTIIAALVYSLKFITSKAHKLKKN